MTMKLWRESPGARLKLFPPLSPCVSPLPSPPPKTSCLIFGIINQNGEFFVDLSSFLYKGMPNPLLRDQPAGMTEKKNDGASWRESPLAPPPSSPSFSPSGSPLHRPPKVCIIFLVLMNNPMESDGFLSLFSTQGEKHHKGEKTAVIDNGAPGGESPGTSLQGILLLLLAPIGNLHFRSPPQSMSYIES